MDLFKSKKESGQTGSCQSDDGVCTLEYTTKAHPESLKFLDSRFRFAGRGDEFIDNLFDIACLSLPRVDEQFIPPVEVEPGEPVPFIPIDPVNIVQMEVKLPPLPAVLMELQEVTNNRYASSANIGEVIAKDPGLTAWILKLVNSPFFGFSVKVDTVSRAVTLVGMQQIQTLAMSGMLNSLIVRMPPDILDMDQFWRHSVATGIAAQSLWKLMGRLESERLFVAGLLHDCGVLALAYAAPKSFRALRTRLAHSNMPLHKLEQELLNFDHPRLGGMLLHRWNMALPLVMAVLRHHDVDSPHSYPEASVVHIADIISTALVDECPVPPICHGVWDSLGISVDKVKDVCNDVQEKLDTMCKVFMT